MIDGRMEDITNTVSLDCKEDIPPRDRVSFPTSTNAFHVSYFGPRVFDRKFLHLPVQ